MPSHEAIDSYFSDTSNNATFVSGLTNLVRSSSDSTAFVKVCTDDQKNNIVGGQFIINNNNINFVIPYYENNFFIYDKPLPTSGSIACFPTNAGDTLKIIIDGTTNSEISIILTGGGIKVTNSSRSSPSQDGNPENYIPGEFFKLRNQWYHFLIPVSGGGNFILLQAVAAPCLLKGTNILTPHGFLKIETLKEDDIILNHELVPISIRKISKMVITWSKTMPADHWVFKIPGPDPVFLTCWHKIRQPDGSFLEACYCELPWAWKEEYVEEDGTFTIYHIHVDDWTNNHLIVNDGHVVESWSGVYSGRTMD